MSELLSQGPAAQYHHYVQLKNGESVLIRAIQPGDKEHLADLFSRLSAQSIYFRFFQVKTSLTPKELAWFTEMDFITRAALAVVMVEGDQEKFLGIGRFSLVSETPRKKAEVAFEVDDAWQGKGVGSLLLDHLIPIARENGIEVFEADVLAKNRQMVTLFNHSGFGVSQSLEEAGVVHIDMEETTESDLIDAHFEREQKAALESLEKVLAPKSVALVGASTKVGSIGYALAHNLAAGEFHGELFFVNPKGGHLMGHKVYSSLKEVTGKVDMVVIAVPSSGVLEVAREAASIGAGALVVITSGFAEIGGEGKVMEEELKRIALGAGMRIVGPNCMGLLNTDPALQLNATFAPQQPNAGNVGFLSQSGALGLAILDQAKRLNIGLSTFISAGNRTDVSSNDLLTWWEEDPRTKVIALYLESFGNPGRFSWLAPRVARKKPIVAVKSGRTAAGSRAAQSHSASLANLDVAVDALFEEVGIIRTQTLEELFEVTSLLATQPVPQGNRVGVVTNAGGPGILIADACEARGLKLSKPTEQTLLELKKFLPAHAGFANPIDMVASASPEEYQKTIELLGNDPNIDSLIVAYIPPLVSRPEDTASAIAKGVGKIPHTKPVLTVFMSSKGAPEELGTGPRGPIPSFSYPENAARALSAALWYRKWKDQEEEPAYRLSAHHRRAVREIVTKAIGESEKPIWLGAQEVQAVLEAAGIPLIPSLVVPADQAVEASKKLGLPIVLKAYGDKILHKTELGAVLLNLRSVQEVEAGLETLKNNLGAKGIKLEEVLIQPFLDKGAEYLAGITRDPTFGPLVVFGTGGTKAELYKDVAFSLPPLSETKARILMNKTKGSGLLDGYRGGEALDRPALTKSLMRLAALAHSVPEILEVDLNPVVALPMGRGAMVLDARIRVGRANWEWGMAPLNR